MQQLLEKEYDGESISDIEEDVMDALNHADLPTDEHGFIQGTIRVIIEVEDD